ncbi:MAG: response regulator transcription factor [Prolixibacteraceae bacterium]|nr:response regulator transcription factor [Prolixibacteraceae bacterium]
MEGKICVLIVDSEQDSIQRIAEILEEDQNVLSVNSANNREQALIKIIDSVPDLILLEIPPEGEAMSDLLKFIKLKLTETKVVLISDKKENAAFAIRNGVFNFLLKPVAKKSLSTIIEKVHQANKNNNRQKISEFISSRTKEKKSLFHTPKGLLLIDQDEIIYCTAHGVYTELCLTHNRKEIVYMFISKIEEILDQERFLRASRKYLLNKNYIRKVVKNDNSIILSHEGNEYVLKSAKHHIKELTRLNSD